MFLFPTSWINILLHSTTCEVRSNNNFPTYQRSILCRLWTFEVSKVILKTRIMFTIGCTISEYLRTYSSTINKPRAEWNLCSFLHVFKAHLFLSWERNRYRWQGLITPWSTSDFQWASFPCGASTAEVPYHATHSWASRSKFLILLFHDVLNCYLTSLLSYNFPAYMFYTLLEHQNHADYTLAYFTITDTPICT